MLTLITKVKVIAFAILGVLAMAYVGFNYANLGHYFGYSGYYTVKVDLTDAGGLLPNGDVTYRGVSVGRVGSIGINGDGQVQANLHIYNSAPKIPANSLAVVSNLSAIGEVYVDLRPPSSTGPYLASNSVIHPQNTQIPPPISSLLTSLNSLTSSIPLASLRTVVDELGQAFNGEGPNLQALLDNSNTFVLAADQHLPATEQLIKSSATVLKTQNAETAALESFSKNARLIAEQLKSSDPQIRRVIAAAIPASQEFDGLIHDIGPSLSVTAANLLTTANLMVTRINGVQELLVKIPQAVANGNQMIDGNGRLNFNMVTTFFNPLPCTSGYGGTTYRNGNDTSTGPAVNTAARCTRSASSGVEVRGPANAPSGGVPSAVQPGSIPINGLMSAPNPVNGQSISAQPTNGQSTSAQPTNGLPEALGQSGLPTTSTSGLAGLLGLQGAQ